MTLGFTDFQFTMAREITSMVRHFLKTQVLRYDYLVVGEATALQSRLPYEQKLERMHDLCIRNGYRPADECDRVRRRLYAEGNKAGRPAALLLIEAYLPDSIVRTGEQDDHQALTLIRDMERKAANLPCKASYLQSSQYHWAGHDHLICLPLDIHFLLIEHDGALLAA